MYFQESGVLWLLALVVPIGASLLLLAYWRRRQLRQVWGQENLIGQGSSVLSTWPYLLRAGLVSVALALLVVAAARPVKEAGRAEFPQGTTDLIVVTDVSRSMGAVDYKGKMPSDSPYKMGTRLDMAKFLVMNEVVPALGANRLGIVTYAGEAFPLAFLTQDVSAVDWVHRRAMNISSAPGNGSALAKSLLMACLLFDIDSDPSHRRIVILFSDGGNDDGLDSLNNVVSEFKKRNIELIVVGLGRNIPSAIPIKSLSPTDQRDFYGKEFYELNGEVVTTQLDENALRLLANRSGGKYMRVVSPSDFSFDMLAQRLEMKQAPGRQQLFMYPLGAGIVLLTVGWLVTSAYVRRWLFFRLGRNDKTGRS